MKLRERIKGGHLDPRLLLATCRTANSVAPGTWSSRFLRWLERRLNVIRSR